ncbi:conserved hypothetical protein [Azoarcus olearius]|uniref:Uncharacterized protein n=2 Tax=Azoarcus sp. (strain BH72) TaxID=418699 RepID=A1K8T9_AZOSB|nr:conserved hypothetical protein [Azoarcus olearius]
MSKMDASEKLVQDHLLHRGYVDVVYEPDGNVPPDFLVNGNIAIEVRRLNQNHFDGPTSAGLEEVAIPLWKKVKALLESMGPPTNGETWFVHFRFSRPVEGWKTLEGKLRSGLQTFAKATNQNPMIVARGQNFELEVFCRASKVHEAMFIMAGCADQESGGWLLSEMETNIRHCASEKERKISKVRPKYPEWWLALVDHIGYSLDEFERELFRDQVSITHNWDRIVIIDPRDHKRWFEI